LLCWQWWGRESWPAFPTTRITTYSILGADFGYRLLWTLLVSTAALVLFHDLTVRLGIATGKGLVSA
jgi:Mn2+/Fe2+ NRAMP family transporter